MLPRFSWICFLLCRLLGSCLNSKSIFCAIWDAQAGITTFIKWLPVGTPLLKGLKPSSTRPHWVHEVQVVRELSFLRGLRLRFGGSSSNFLMTTLLSFDLAVLLLVAIIDLYNFIHSAFPTFLNLFSYFPILYSLCWNT